MGNSRAFSFIITLQKHQNHCYLMINGSGRNVSVWDCSCFCTMLYIFKKYYDGEYFLWGHIRSQRSELHWESREIVELFCYLSLPPFRTLNNAKINTQLKITTTIQVQVFVLYVDQNMTDVIWCEFEFQLSLWVREMFIISFSYVFDLIAGSQQRFFTCLKYIP